MHVVTLLVSIPVIVAMATSMVWAMGGTGWQILTAAVCAWLLVILIYLGQLFLQYLKIRHEMARHLRERASYRMGEDEFPIREGGADQRP